MSEEKEYVRIAYRKRRSRERQIQAVLFVLVFTVGLATLAFAASYSVTNFENKTDTSTLLSEYPNSASNSNEATSTTEGYTSGSAAFENPSTAVASGGGQATSGTTHTTPTGSGSNTTAPVTTPTQAPTPVSNPKPTPTPTPSPSPTPIPTPVLIPTPTPGNTPAPTPEPAPAPSSAGSKFGLSIAGTLLGLSDFQVGARLDEIAKTGVKWIRIDVGWNDIEKRDKDHTDWTGIDRIVNAANERGIQVLGILSYTPRWARDEGCPEITCPPRDNDEFAAYAAAAAHRYGPKGVHTWEIWNEQNLNMNYWGNTASRYSDLLRRTYSAIKNEDPKALVISGGLSPAATRDGSMSPVDFLNALYANGAGDSFDAVGMHPYSFPATPDYTIHWNAWSQMGDISTSLRSVMVSNGDSAKKIWLTEFGAPTGGPGNLATLSNYKNINNSDHVTEELQAEMVRDSFTLAQSYSWAGPLFWYSYKDLGTDGGDNENFFGIVRYDGSHKPAYDVIRSMLGMQ